MAEAKEDNFTSSTVTMGDGTERNVRHPKGWSKRRVELWAYRNNKPKQVEGETVSVADLMNAQLVEDVSYLIPDPIINWAMGAPLFPDEGEQGAFSPMYGLDVAQYNAASPEERSKIAATAKQERQQQKENLIRGIVGIPEDYEYTTTDLVVKEFGSPLTYAGLGRNLAKTKLGKLLNTVGQAGEIAVSTPAAVYAQQATNDLTGIAPVDEIISSTIGMLSGTASGVGVASARNVANIPFKVAEKGYVEAKDAVSGESVKTATDKANAVSELLAQKQIQAKLANISQNMEPAEVAKAVENIQDIKEFIPNLELEGISGAIVDNPVVAEVMRNVAQHDAGYVVELQRKTKQNFEALTDKLGDLSGSLGAIDETQLYDASVSVFNRQKEKLEKQNDKASVKYEEDMAKLVNRLDAESPDLVGERVKALSSKRESELRAKADKLYDVAKVAAKNQSLPMQYAARLAGVAQASKAADMFGPESKTAKQLRENWTPKETLEEIDGIEIEIPTVADVSLADFGSLKKAISTDLTKLYQVRYKDPSAPQRIAKLEALRTTVKGVLTDMTVDPKTRKYANQLNKADSFYFESIGLPMRADGMALINNTKFNQDTANHLVSSSQKAREYLNFVGEKEGVPVLRHAMRMKAEQSVIGADGTVSQQKLANFLNNKTNRELIEMAKLNKEFSDLNKTSKTIRGTRERHKANYDAKSEELSNGFFKMIMNQNLGGVVKSMRSNPAQRKQIMREVDRLTGKNKELILAGIRNTFVKQGMTSQTKPMADYMLENKASVIDIFGAEYLGDLQKFGKVFDLVVKQANAVSKTLGSDLDLDTLQQTAGISVERSLGLFRNQILSAQRKIINAGSTIFLNKAQKRYYKAAAQMLSDPAVLKELANPPAESLTPVKDRIKKTAKDVKDRGKAISKDIAADFKATVIPYYVEVLNNAGIFSALRSTAALQEEEELIRGAEAPQ
jgi:hypothetical protein